MIRTMVLINIGCVMKTLINIIKIGALAVTAFFLAACQNDELVKPSALLVESSLTFEAMDAEPQQLTIASDDYWMIDVDVDWISVDPMSGTNTKKVNVCVDDNVENGTMSGPRQGVVTIANRRGYMVTAVIYQKGDNYLGVEEYDLAGVSALDDDVRAKVKQSQVVALTTDGFLASDDSKVLYILGNQEKVKIGDNITMNGVASTTNSVKTFTSDEIVVLSNSEVMYPEALDVTASIRSYSSTSIEYIKVSGTLIGKGLRVGSKVNAAICYNPGIDVDTFNLHEVDAYGYSFRYSGSLYFVPTYFFDRGEAENLEYYPVKYQVGKTPINFDTESFGAEGKIEPVEGLGYIQYVTSNLENSNADGYYKLDVVDNNPRVTGAWPDDYWLFYCYGAVKAGSEIEITFETRTSAGGMMYWILEYLDGDSWKPACETFNASDVDCVYSHKMYTDGKTNVQVYAKVKIKKNMDSCQFRFRCAANWRCNGKGALKNRSGGTGRLAVTDVTDDTYQPRISVLKEGDGVEIGDTDPVEAIVELSDDLLTFEGTPEAPLSFTVNSNVDFTAKSQSDWLTLDVSEGEANKETTISVTCEPSSLSTMRKSEIIISAGETKKSVRVVQSAAGQDLDPFISLSTGNIVKPLGEGAEFDVKVQHNVEFKTEFSEDWLSEVDAPSTSAVVDYTTKRFKAAANLTGVARTGKIRFYNDDYEIESVLTVSQDKFEPNVEVTCYGPYIIAGIGETRNVNIVTNVPFTVTAPDWITFPESVVNVAGTYPVSVAFAANTGEVRTGDVVFNNAEYGYTKIVSITQSATGVVFFDDFGWLTPMIDEYNSLNPTAPVPNPVTGYSADDYVAASTASGASPNMYTKEPFASKFPTLFENLGYEDMNPSVRVLYPQDTYLKLCKTNVQTSLKLPAWGALTEASDVSIEFDWCAFIRNTGNVDEVTLTLVIAGNGTFENGTKYSDPLSNTQKKTQFFWTHSEVKLKGVDKDTRVNIVYTDQLDKETGTYKYNVSGAHRWFIDNIKVTK